MEGRSNLMDPFRSCASVSPEFFLHTLTHPPSPFFTKAIRYCQEKMDFEDGEEQLQKDLHACKVACFLNIALCYMKQRRYHMVIHECDKILEMTPLETKNQVKAYFRRGQAHREEKDMLAALADLEKAHQLDGGKDAGVAKEYEAIRVYLKETTEKEKALYAQMWQ